MHNHNDESSQFSRESGQASVLLLLMLSTFMLAMLAFAVDLAGMWFHRQAVQSAADAACLAGASDMLASQVGVTPPGSGFTPGTAGNCASSAAAPLCQYAGFNGYAGAGLSTTAASNSVSWTFPSTVAGTTAPGGTVTNPFLNVVVIENVKTYFMGLLGIKYQEVGATATCGLNAVLTTPPIVVLDPTASGALAVQGSPVVQIIGGPSRSIQVDSSSATGATGGGHTGVNTTLAGPNGTGGDVAVFGAETSAPGTYSLGTGNWISGALPFPDPFAAVPAPSPLPGTAALAVVHNVPYETDGCPDTGLCDEYSPGYYSGGIDVKNVTAIFKPGIYVVDGDFAVDANGAVRNAYVGSKTAVLTTSGVMFYMRTGAFTVAANSGRPVTDTVPVSTLSCDGSVPAGIPTTPLNGSVLNAQCTTDGTYSGSGGTGVLSSTGRRGLLFFEAHTDTASPAYDSQGGGAFLLSGTEYFHSTASPGIINLQGNPSGTTYMLGYIVTDQLSAGGNAALSMVLSSLPTVTTLKIALLQ